MNLGDSLVTELVVLVLKIKCDVWHSINPHSENYVLGVIHRTLPHNFMAEKDRMFEHPLTKEL